MRYFINHEGLQKGPWTIEEIKQKISANEISPMDYVFFDEDRADWVVMMAYAPFTSILKPGGPVEVNPQCKLQQTLNQKMIGLFFVAIAQIRAV